MHPSSAAISFFTSGDTMIFLMFFFTSMDCLFVEYCDNSFDTCPLLIEQGGQPVGDWITSLFITISRFCENLAISITIVAAIFAVVVGRNRQQLGVISRRFGLRIFLGEVAALDLRGQHRQLLVAPCLAKANRESHRRLNLSQEPSIAHDLRFIVPRFHNLLVSLCLPPCVWLIER